MIVIISEKLVFVTSLAPLELTVAIFEQVLDILEFLLPLDVELHFTITVVVPPFFIFTVDKLTVHVPPAVPVLPPAFPPVVLSSLTLTAIV